MRVLTSYRLTTGKLSRPYTLAVVSDIHNEPYDDIWPLVEGADVLLAPGDIADRYRHQAEQGIAFLRDAAKRMPTFFSPGNHEAEHMDFSALMKQIEDAGATALVNRYVSYEELWIGGWYSPEVVGRSFPMDEYEALPGCKVLLCHKPQHYIKYLRNRQLDLVVAGHAHGGQLRLGNQGLYAPGQGFFPRYTRGVADGRMIISAGAGNPSGFPRWNNPCEVLKITLT